LANVFGFENTRLDHARAGKSDGADRIWSILNLVNDAKGIAPVKL
jgi:hypothetical protein